MADTGFGFSGKHLRGDSSSPSPTKEASDKCVVCSEVVTEDLLECSWCDR